MTDHFERIDHLEIKVDDLETELEQETRRINDLIEKKVNGLMIKLELLEKSLCSCPESTVEGPASWECPLHGVFEINYGQMWRK